ncbi:uveal autoantigen with coiled-coil domains and ankyrin repeats protein-like isoform X2 [Anopheles albimanus]|uniref:uveal autoantigen with coiled-coil domains and ankyrin repeats protein-like isoform X2 n=1 Tax=Anopheles albimanus TaxID=7167 RepID=UPI00163FDB2B|nr:uveal autoantigen with coiled-coil domains and ankyrin repeats protein-like isoform X2 [Anopheles albimanus]
MTAEPSAQTKTPHQCDDAGIQDSASTGSPRKCIVREMLCFFEEAAAVLNGSNQPAELDWDGEQFFDDACNGWVGDPDNRSVDEILHEAELLICQQPVFRRNGESIDRAHPATLQELACEAKLAEVWNGLLEDLANAERKDAERAAAEQQTEPNRLDWSNSVDASDRATAYSNYQSTVNVATNSSELTDVEEPDESECFSDGGSTISLGQHSYGQEEAPRLTVLPGDAQQLISSSTAGLQVAGDERSRVPSPVPATCDKSTQPSPTRESPSASGELMMLSKYRELESRLLHLHEQVKDSEERYQSLRIQYESLAQAHRTLRDLYNSKQDESEKLEFDIQHLTKCVEVLRSELKSARNERDFAVELQGLLQSELEDARSDKKKLQESTEKDTRTIQDLQRQCREMERILMRKNPDAISGLIVATKVPQGKSEGEGGTLLRRTPEQTEADVGSIQHTRSYGVLADVQARFSSVQAKYETHIRDLEMQVLSLQEINSKLNERIIQQMEELAIMNANTANQIAAASSVAIGSSTSSSTQTEPAGIGQAPAKRQSVMVQTDHLIAKPLSIRQQQTKRAQAQNKEDAHLLATIGGMRADLATKEKTVQRLTREVEECKKTIRKLQKKKEGLGKSDCGKSPVKVRKKVLENAESAVEATLAESQGAPKAKNLELDHHHKALQEQRLQEHRT